MLRLVGLEKAYPDLEALLQDREVRQSHHGPPTGSISNKPAVVCKQANIVMQKPLAMNAVESAELVKLAEKSDAAGVCYNLRFYPLNFEAAICPEWRGG